MLFSLLCIVVAFVAEVTATTYNPFGAWRSIAVTLPGSSFKKRDVASPELDRRALVERGRWKDLYSSCGYLNMASKYKQYPINGYGFASIGLDFGGRYTGRTFPGLVAQYTQATSAYDCCQQTMQNRNSTMWFFSSNPSAFRSPCTIVYNTVNPIAPLEILEQVASYNGSAPCGTSYGNYIGNGNIGPGVRYAVNNANNGLCIGATGGSGVQGPNDGSSGASAASSACSYTNTQRNPDQGGENPVGTGSSAGSGSSSSSNGQDVCGAGASGAGSGAGLGQSDGSGGIGAGAGSGAAGGAASNDGSAGSGSGSGAGAGSGGTNGNGGSGSGSGSGAGSGQASDNGSSGAGSGAGSGNGQGTGNGNTQSGSGSGSGSGAGSAGPTP